MDVASGAGPGPVALVGSGEFTPAMASVDRMLLEGRPPRVVFLPTAAGLEGDERVDYWVEMGLGHYRDLGVEAEPVLALDRNSADDPDLALRVQGAGLVYLSGGNPAYLAETLAGTRVFEAILDAWSGGAALAGCSAGACALTDVVFDNRYPGRRRAGLAVVRGVVVLPHFGEIEGWWPGVVDRWLGDLAPGGILVGIDEDTAIVGGPGRFQVHGAGAAWVIDADGRHPFPVGTVVDLAPAPVPSGEAIHAPPDTLKSP